MQLLANANFSYIFDALPAFFHSFHLNDFFDVLLVAFFVYVILIFIKQTRSYFIFNTFLLLFVITYLSRILDLSLSRKLFEPLVAFFAVIFVVVFQREIRRFLKWFVLSRDRLGRHPISLDGDISDAIVYAVMTMARKRSGALIILAGEYPLDDVVEGGFPLNGEITAPLLLSIFDKHSAGHDGAVLVENKRLKSFGLHLPLAEEFKSFATLGTRHRAALGLSERTDAMVIVVSEERGMVSIAQSGALRTVADKQGLENAVRAFIKENTQEVHDFWHYVLVKNFLIKVLSIVIALLLWLLLVFQANISNRDLVVPIEFTHIPLGIIVERVIPTDTTITVSGNSRDVGKLTNKDIKVTIDLSKATTAGTEKIDITREDIALPSYINVVSVSPNAILIGIQKASP